MQSTKAQLLDAVSAIKSKKILLIGDVVLDKYVWGSVTRISQEAPVPIVEVKKIESRLGGAGNVAQNLANLGVQVLLAGIVGNDQESQELTKIFKGSKISTEGLIKSDDRPTTVKTRIIAHQQQVCRIDKESRSACGEKASRAILKFVEANINKVDGIILSDYGKGIVSEPLLRLIEENVASGKLGLKAGIPYAVDPSPANYHRYKKMTYAKPNRNEAEVASGVKITDVDSAIKASRILIKRWGAECMLISLGEDGLVITFADAKKKPFILPTVARKVFDVSGAGDCVTAVFTAALAAGKTPQLAGELANIAAGYVVSEVGTVAIKKDSLLAEIDHHLG